VGNQRTGIPGSVCRRRSEHQATVFGDGALVQQRPRVCSVHSLRSRAAQNRSWRCFRRTYSTRCDQWPGWCVAELGVPSSFRRAPSLWSTAVAQASMHAWRVASFPSTSSFSASTSMTFCVAMSAARRSIACATWHSTDTHAPPEEDVRVRVSGRLTPTRRQAVASLRQLPHLPHEPPAPPTLTYKWSTCTL
jgi:hypothetical protein